MKALVRQVTTLQVPSLVPEVRLRLADEPLIPWQATERMMGAIQPPPFWAHAWPGGLALARVLLDSPALVKGKRVLDFASGCGVGGIAAALAGASDVLATEVDAFALAAIEENAALNHVSVRTASADVIDGDEGWETVLVGDVFYQDALSRRVLAWLQKLSARGADILIGDPGRSFLPVAFLECLATFPVVCSPEWDSVVDRPARVWRLSRVNCACS